GVDPARIRVIQGDGDPRYGDQDTDGSQSIRSEFDAIRQLGAVARTLLVTAAAKRWGIPASRCTTRDGAVHDDGTRSIGFGELVPAAAALPVPKPAQLRPIKELVPLGPELPLRDGPDYVTGRANYGADIRLPGMLTAVIAHPPAVLGKVAKLDAMRAK